MIKHEKHAFRCIFKQLSIAEKGREALRLVEMLET